MAESAASLSVIEDELGIGANGAGDDGGMYVFDKRTLEAAIKKELPSTTVTINPEKPRKGCFEVTVGSSVVLSLLNMPRPFPKLKALDIEGKVADDVIKALK